MRNSIYLGAVLGASVMAVPVFVVAEISETDIYVYSDIVIDGVEGVQITKLKDDKVKEVTLPTEIEGKPLIRVKIEDAYLTKVDVSKAKHLRELSFHNNDLTTIDLSGLENLEVLRLSANRLSKVDLTKNLKIKDLDVSFNFISELGVGYLRGLVNLNVSTNKISKLDVQKMSSLESLNGFKNELTELNVSNLLSLKNLSVQDNYIQKLDVKELTNLTVLDVRRNPLEELDVEKLQKLRTLNITNTGITTIDDSNLNDLRTFNFHLTPIKLEEYQRLVAKRGHLRSTTLKPNVYLERVSERVVRADISVEESEISNVEIAWTLKDGVPVKWEEVYDLEKSYNDGRWIRKKTQGYGVYSSDKKLDFEIPYKLYDDQYRFHIRVTDVNGGVVLKQSFDLYKSNGNEQINLANIGQDSRIKDFGEHYEMNFGATTVKVPKVNIGVINPSVAVKDGTFGEKVVKFELAEKGMEFKDFVEVEFKDNLNNQLIPFKRVNNVLQFVPQEKLSNSTKVKLKNDADIVFSYEYNVNFLDVPLSHYSKNSVESLVKYGVVKGITDAEYGGSKEITRAEFAVLLTRALGLTVNKSNTMTFKDVEPNKWYASSIQTLYEAGYIAGKTKTAFGPNDKITRQDAAVLMLRMINNNAQVDEVGQFVIPDINEVSPYAKNATQKLRNMGIINGADSKGNFKPKNNITRYEMAVLLNSTLKKMKFK